MFFCVCQNINLCTIFLHPDDFVRGRWGGAIGGCNPFLPSTELHSYGMPLVYSIPMQSKILRKMAQKQKAVAKLLSITT